MSIAIRITKLENARAPKVRRPYVYRVSNSPTSQELSEIKAASWPHAILPRKCATIAEWVMRHEPRRTLQCPNKFRSGATTIRTRRRQSVP
jgi:hypothetical protein